MDAVKDFEADRKYGFAWNVLDTTILKILLRFHPQGQLLNDLNKAVSEMDQGRYSAAGSGELREVCHPLTGNDERAMG